MAKPLILRFLCSRFAGMISRTILRWLGWRISVIPPNTHRYVLIGAHHTSNWDFIFAMLFISAQNVPMRIMGKDTLFWWPLGVIMRSIGVMPVNRREHTNLVDNVAQKFSEHSDLIIGIAPEGTRKKTTHWRTGFYYIALKARVPIVMAFLDYKKKICGLGPSLVPTGDIQADFKLIRDFYADITGKYPEKQSDIVIHEKKPFAE